MDVPRHLTGQIFRSAFEAPVAKYVQRTEQNDAGVRSDGFCRVEQTLHCSEVRLADFIGRRCRMCGSAVVDGVYAVERLAHYSGVADIAADCRLAMFQESLPPGFIAIHGPHALALFCEPTQEMATDKTSRSCDKRCHTKPL